MFRDGAARLLVFRVGRERFAVPLSDVDEVIDAQIIQRVPDAPAGVMGVIAIRGSLVTVYDVRPLLGVGGDADGALLLFNHDERRIGVAIDDVFDAVTIEAHELLAVPRRAASDGLLTGMLRRGNELVAVLNSAALLDAVTEARDGESHED